MSFHEVIVSKPSRDRRWTGAMSVIELIVVKRFLCPTNELQEPMSVQVLNFKHSICDRPLSLFKTILYI